MISFHSRLALAEMTSKELVNIGIYSETVKGTMSTKRREDAFKRFKKKPKAVLTNAFALQEGIDIKKVDSIFFSSPKSSTISIVQAIGRALRLDPDNPDKVAAIIVPVYTTGDVNEQVNDSSFKGLYQLISSISATDYRVRAFVEGFTEGKGERGESKPIDHIKLADYERLDFINFSERLRNAFVFGTLKKKRRTFEENFEMFKDFIWNFSLMDVLYKINENIFNCSVKIEDSVYTYNYLIDELGKRHKRKYNRAIKSPIIEKVNTKNFDKSTLSKDQLDELLIYLKTKEARIWKTKLRSLRRKGKLEQHKIDKLNELGMLWNPTTDPWEKMYRDFKDDVLDTHIGYMLRKEYSSPSIIWINNYENWVNEQKSLFKKEIISKENLVRLNYVGFQFGDDDGGNDKFGFLRLIKLIVFIMNLSSNAGKGGERERMDFIEYYNLKDQENHIGSYLFIREKTYFSKLDYVEHQISQMQIHIDRINKRDIKKFDDILSNART